MRPFHIRGISAILFPRMGDGVMETLNCGAYTVNLFTGGESQSVVYAVLDGEDAAKVWALLKAPRPALAVVSNIDWNRDLSPWAAPRAFRGSNDFGGGGPTFLAALTGKIMPLAEGRLGFAPQSRTIAGYSLAGLFALWSVFQSDVFDRAASVSGSLWFDGFLDYMGANAPFGGLRRVYLSLGDKEKNTRNSRMAVVEMRTREAAELLRERDISVLFELDPGGHFQDVPARIAQGINAVMDAQ